MPSGDGIRLRSARLRSCDVFLGGKDRHQQNEISRHGSGITHQTPRSKNKIPTAPSSHWWDNLRLSKKDEFWKCFGIQNIVIWCIHDIELSSPFLGTFLAGDAFGGNEPSKLRSLRSSSLTGPLPDKPKIYGYKYNCWLEKNPITGATGLRVGRAGATKTVYTEGKAGRLT
jgi:hypothetical protein